MFYTNSSQSSTQLAKLAETINGKFVSAISNTAKENHIQVIGSFYEKSRKKNRVFDTSFIINESGKIIYIALSKSSIKSEKWEKEVLQLIKEWKFPPIYRPDDVTEVNYPFVFSP